MPGMLGLQQKGITGFSPIKPQPLFSDVDSIHAWRDLDVISIRGYKVDKLV
jgi:hypothetical protein